MYTEALILPAVWLKKIVICIFFGPFILRLAKSKQPSHFLKLNPGTNASRRFLNGRKLMRLILKLSLKVKLYHLTFIAFP